MATKGAMQQVNICMVLMPMTLLASQMYPRAFFRWETRFYLRIAKILTTSRQRLTIGTHCGLICRAACQLDLRSRPVGGGHWHARIWGSLHHDAGLPR